MDKPIESVPAEETKLSDYARSLRMVACSWPERSITRERLDSLALLCDHWAKHFPTARLIDLCVTRVEPEKL